jgi:maltooligosyltrehalose trehalohydrolase
VIREFVVENAIYWVEEFHLDGLRIAAVHAINDDSDTHSWKQLPTASGELPPAGLSIC